jgi:hypothetical protein
MLVTTGKNRQREERNEDMTQPVRLTESQHKAIAELRERLPIEMFPPKRNRYAPKRTNHSVVELMLKVFAQNVPEAKTILEGEDADSKR